MRLNGQLTQSRGLESALAWPRLICLLVVPSLTATLVHVNNQLESFLLKLLRVFFTKVVTRMDTTKSGHHPLLKYFIQPGEDPGFFFRRGALVSWSTSTPINHILFFLQKTSCIRKPQVISGGGGGGGPPPPPHPLHPPPRSAPENSHK